jgi:hypothetical protein
MIAKEEKRKRLRAAAAAALSLPAASCEMELCHWAALNYTLPLITICLSCLSIYFYLFTEPRRRKRPSFQIRAACDRDCSQIAPCARAVPFLSSEPRTTGRSTCCLTRICKAKPVLPLSSPSALLIPPVLAYPAEGIMLS